MGSSPYSFGKNIGDWLYALGPFGATPATAPSSLAEQDRLQAIEDAKKNAANEAWWERFRSGVSGGPDIPTGFVGPPTPPDWTGSPFPPAGSGASPARPGAETTASTAPPQFLSRFESRSPWETPLPESEPERQEAQAPMQADPFIRYQDPFSGEWRDYAKGERPTGTVSPGDLPGTGMPEHLLNPFTGPAPGGGTLSQTSRSDAQGFPIDIPFGQWPESAKQDYLTRPSVALAGMLGKDPWEEARMLADIKAKAAGTQAGAVAQAEADVRQKQMTQFETVIGPEMAEAQKIMEAQAELRRDPRYLALNPKARAIADGRVAAYLEAVQDRIRMKMQVYGLASDPRTLPSTLYRDKY